jgi:hypothetical protein
MIYAWASSTFLRAASTSFSARLTKKHYQPITQGGISASWMLELLNLDETVISHAPI